MRYQVLPTSLSDDQAAPLHEHGSAAVDDHGADCFVVLADPGLGELQPCQMVRPLTVRDCRRAGRRAHSRRSGRLATPQRSSVHARRSGHSVARHHRCRSLSRWAVACQYGAMSLVCSSTRPVRAGRARKQGSTAGEPAGQHPMLVLERYIVPGQRPRCLSAGG